jgi:hypothetical protein
VKIRSVAAHLPLRIVAIILLGAGCAGGDGQGDMGEAAFHGYMTFRPEAAKFGFTPGDTLVEVPAGRAPAVLRRQVERDVRDFGYKAGCTRYFGSGSAVVVFFLKYCDRNPPDLVDQVDAVFHRRSDHYWELVLFRREGDRFVPVRQPDFEETIDTWCPPDRDRRGRVVTGCS